MRRGAGREALVVLWAVALSALVLGPALGPGFLLVRDMVWVPDLALRADTLGLGSGLPRAVPSDAVVAVLDQVVPAMLLQKLVLGLGLVAERFLMGAWPLLVGYAVLPWVLGEARRWRAQARMPPALLVLVPLGCL